MRAVTSDFYYAEIEICCDSGNGVHVIARRCRNVQRSQRSDFAPGRKDAVGLEVRLTFYVRGERRSGFCLSWGHDLVALTRLKSGVKEGTLRFTNIFSLGFPIHLRLKDSSVWGNLRKIPPADVTIDVWHCQ